MFVSVHSEINLRPYMLFSCPICKKCLILQANVFYVKSVAFEVKQN